MAHGLDRQHEILSCVRFQHVAQSSCPLSLESDGLGFVLRKSEDPDLGGDGADLASGYTKLAGILGAK